MDERLKILVVEDDPVYAEFVATTLRGAGHEVDIAGSGAAARERARAWRPDAVILDLGLPDESGYEVGRALRREILGEAAIIILLTASLYPQRDMADAVGIDIVFSKPVEPQLVTGMVDLIHQRRSTRPGK